ncbi:hypothetical protein BBJ28_00019957 [Nothophytophthora sp. Chile5]|nr:hypothetical protein BBJ28_00019957 [Nothophytophthora sp. Chile5]
MDATMPEVEQDSAFSGWSDRSSSDEDVCMPGADAFSPEYLDIHQDHPLYDEAVQAMEKAALQLKPSARRKYSLVLNHFREFYVKNDVPDPLVTRSVILPTIRMVCLYRVTNKTKTYSPAELARSAISWLYKTPKMNSSGNSPENWIVLHQANGTLLPTGNPTKAYIVQEVCRTLQKGKRCTNRPRRSVPMDIENLSKMQIFLEKSQVMKPGVVAWMMAVSPLAFYTMARISEVLGLRFSDVSLGLTRPSRDDETELIHFGSLMLRDRKTSKDPTESWCYYLPPP